MSTKFPDPFQPLTPLFIITVLFLFNIHCGSSKQLAFKAKKVYTTSSLVITQVAENSFEHTSYLQTNDFGNVPCNGLIVRNKNEAIVFDTPTNDTVSAELIGWIRDNLHCTIKAIIPTHFHKDCLGGLGAFHGNNIPSYANAKTIELAKANQYILPQHGFSDSLILKMGDEPVTIKFFGEGHTKDNVVGYFPADKVMFGGCLIKETGATKGYLGDANLAEWSATVEKVKNAYPDVKVIIPGHGKYGGIPLLDYTINLFRVK